MAWRQARVQVVGFFSGVLEKNTPTDLFRKWQLFLSGIVTGWLTDIIDDRTIDKWKVYNSFLFDRTFSRLDPAVQSLISVNPGLTQ